MLSQPIANPTYSRRDARNISLTVLFKYFTPMSPLSALQFLAIYTSSFDSCPLERMLVLLAAARRPGKLEVKLELRQSSRDPTVDRCPDNHSCLPFPNRLAHRSPLFVGAHRRRLRNHHRKTSGEGLVDRVRIEVREAMSRRLAPAEVLSFRQNTLGVAVLLLGLLYLHKGVVWVAHGRIRRQFLW